MNRSLSHVCVRWTTDLTVLKVGFNSIDEVVTTAHHHPFVAHRDSPLVRGVVWLLLHDFDFDFRKFASVRFTTHWPRITRNLDLWMRAFGLVRPAGSIEGRFGRAAENLLNLSLWKSLLHLKLHSFRVCLGNRHPSVLTGLHYIDKATLGVRKVLVDSVALNHGVDSSDPGGACSVGLGRRRRMSLSCCESRRG